jgi:hypothetical protein
LYAYMRYNTTATTKTTRPISMGKILSRSEEWPDPAPDFTIGEALWTVKLYVSAMCAKYRLPILSVRTVPAAGWHFCIPILNPKIFIDNGKE